MRQIPLRWVLLAGLVYAALMAMFFLIFILPQNIRIKDLKLKLRGDGENSSETQKEAEIDALRSGLKEARAGLEKSVSIAGKLVLTRVLNTAQRAQITVVSVVPFSKSNAANPAGTAELKIVFTGSYAQITNFIHLLESDQVLFRIDGLTLENVENLHRGEIDIVHIQNE